LSSKMKVNTENQAANFVQLASDLVSAYVSNNSLPASELPSLIESVHAALAKLAAGIVEALPEATHEKPSSAQIRRSVMPDGIVSFLDGKSYKTLKRHLTGHGFDPHTYRQRFGLPADYPMVAPNYAAQRSALAKSIGLGQVSERTRDTKPKEGRRTARA
jgi:predicted transcriptional regulator